MTHRRKTLAWLTCFLLLLFLGGAPALAWEFEYELVKPGDTYNINLRTGNSSGLVVGFSDPLGLPFEADSGGITFYGLPSGYYYLDMNDANTFDVGFTATGSPLSETGYYGGSAVMGVASWLYDDGTGARPTIINGTNESNSRMVGVYLADEHHIICDELFNKEMPPDLLVRGFWRDLSGSEVHAIEYPGASQTYAWDVNDSGLVVGYYLGGSPVKWHGFTYDINTGTYTTLDFSDDGLTYQTFLTGVNNAGQISGYFSAQDDVGPAPVLGYMSGAPEDEWADPILHIVGLVYRDGAFIPIDIFKDTRLFSVMEDGRLVGDVPVMNCPGVNCGEGELQCRNGIILTVTDSPSTQPAPPGASPAIATSFAVDEIPIPGDPAEEFEVFGFFMFDLNDNGVVAGMATDLSDPEGDLTGKPMLWNAEDGMTQLATELEWGVITDVNNAGTAVGFGMPEDGSGQILGSWTEADGGLPIPYLSSCDGSFYALISFIRTLVNENDMMSVIRSWNNDHTPVLLFERNRFEQTARTAMSDLPTNGAMPVDMNDYNQVISWNFPTSINPADVDVAGVIWDPNHWKSVTIPYDGTYIYQPSAINNSGMVTVNRFIQLEDSFGIAEASAYVREPDGTMLALPASGVYTNCAATDVNDLGEVVGFMWNSSQNFREVRIVMWQRTASGYGNPVDITERLAGQGYDLTTYTTWGIDDAMDILEPYDVFFILSFQIGPKINNASQILTMATKEGTPMGVLLTPEPSEDCIEDTTGMLDVVGQAICSASGLIDVPIRIQEALVDSDAFGFEVTFDPAVLSFVEMLPGDLLASFDYKQANLVAPGVVRVGAYTLSGEVAADQSGILCYIRFSVENLATTQVDLQNLVDDMAGWSTSPGCIKRSDGDLNIDGEITPADALCALEKAMVVCPTSCGLCSETLCDVNMDCDCTADDALCLFYRYLALPSCLDDLLD